MASKIKVDQIQTGDGTGTIALQNQLSGMTSASMPAGSVVNQSFTQTASSIVNTSTTPAATAIHAAITPTSATNKMLIHLDIQVYRSQNSTGTRLWLYRDIGGGGFSNFLLFNYYAGYANDGGTDVHNSATVTLEDTSYDSTSAVTYKVYMAMSHGTGDVRINQNANVSSILVQEIAL